MSTNDLEAKIVVLGAQGVGKTSLLTRFIHNSFLPSSAQAPTIGATFLTKRLTSPSDHPSCTIRLQIWDTAGQERFRSISKLYYRGANAAILCYDVTDAHSFIEMGNWLRELKEYNGGMLGDGNGNGEEGEECIVHIVGTKADVVAEDPRRREVPFEQCITYVAKQLHGFSPSSAFSTPGLAAQNAPINVISQSHSTYSNSNNSGHTTHLQSASATSHTSTNTTNTAAKSDSTASPTPATSRDPRHSGFWGADTAWDSCHEISAKDGEGVEEVFRVIVRKLVEQQTARQRRKEFDNLMRMAGEGKGAGRLDSGKGGLDGGGSFRVGIGDKRRSWLGFPSSSEVGGGAEGVGEGVDGEGVFQRKRGGKCC